jgi:hypothetical protein
MNTKSQYRSFHYDNESPTLNAELQKIGFEEIEVCKETDPERYETLQDELGGTWFHSVSRPNPRVHSRAIRRKRVEEV